MTPEPSSENMVVEKESYLEKNICKISVAWCVIDLHRPTTLGKCGTTSDVSACVSAYMFKTCAICDDRYSGVCVCLSALVTVSKSLAC